MPNRRFDIINQTGADEIGAGGRHPKCRFCSVHFEINLRLKQASFPVCLALLFMMEFILSILQGENFLLLGLSPSVALLNMMKFPSGEPGEQTALVSESCCQERSFSIPID